MPYSKFTHTSHFDEDILVWHDALRTQPRFHSVLWKWHIKRLEGLKPRIKKVCLVSNKIWFFDYWIWHSNFYLFWFHRQQIYKAYWSGYLILISSSLYHHNSLANITELWIWQDIQQKIFIWFEFHFAVKFVRMQFCIVNIIIFS